MACNKGRVNPDTTTKFRLFADSGGFCQKPDCHLPLFRDVGDEVIHVAEMAHIIASSNKGPRSDEDLDEVERSAYVNLILLCPTCHTEIDKVDEQYPVELIQRWKNEHKNRLNYTFGLVRCEDRFSAKRLADRFIRENRLTHQMYGPMTEERLNPESSAPRIWRLKMLEVIIPNNRKLLSLFDLNDEMLNESELLVVDKFRQHTKDLELRHILGENICGETYPIEVDGIFEEKVQ